MKPVFLASPLSAPDTRTLRRHVAYARRAAKHSISLLEAPFVPHLLFTQFLDDKDAQDRLTGTSAGNIWLARAEALVVYADLGISAGMSSEITLAVSLKIPVEIRYIKTGIPRGQTPQAEDLDRGPDTELTEADQGEV